MTATAFVDDHTAIVPNPAGEMCALPLLPAIHLAWQRLPSDAALLVLFFGINADRGVVTTLTRDGLHALIADLQSIEVQL